jgi:hypothetical protein
MYDRLLQPLRQALKREYRLALLPTLIIALPAGPYLLIMTFAWLTKPNLLEDDWTVVYFAVLVGLILLGALSLWLVRWVAGLGYLRASELLETTDVLLYAMMQDTSFAVREVAKPVLEIEVLETKGKALGCFTQRIIRMATHFDRWCRTHEERYILHPVSKALVIMNTVALLVAFLLFTSSYARSFIWFWPLGVALALSLIYLHIVGCGKRIGALRALVQFLTEEYEI